MVRTIYKKQIRELGDISEEAKTFVKDFQTWRQTMSPYFNASTIRLEEVGLFCELLKKNLQDGKP